jgi:hypothetical protein
MVFQLSVECGSAHDEFSFSFICFLPFAGSVKKIAIKDQMKVGSVFTCDDVSGDARSQPLYAPLQGILRFIHPLCPAFIHENNKELRCS